MINELYRSLILDDFENFDEETRVLDGFSYVEELKIDQNSSKADIKVTQNPLSFNYPVMTLMERFHWKLDDPM